jgi:hypothetical protein
MEAGEALKSAGLDMVKDWWWDRAAEQHAAHMRLDVAQIVEGGSRVALDLSWPETLEEIGRRCRAAAIEREYS